MLSHALPPFHAGRLTSRRAPLLLHLLMCPVRGAGVFSVRHGSSFVSLWTWLPHLQGGRLAQVTGLWL
jgi:hypothetical protein